MSNLFKSKFFLGVMIAVVMLVGVVAFASTSSAADCSITTTLRVGSRGDQVKCLQSNLSLTVDGAFGPKTAAAVKAWQATKGLVADGIFGAKSRAAWSGSTSMTGGNGDLCPNGMTLASNCTAAPSMTPSVTLCPNGMTLASNCSAAPTGTPVVSSGPVSVSLSSDNPASRSVVSTEAGADLAHFMFTGNGTVTSVSLKRMGISADASLSSVYLYNGATRLTDASSVSNNGAINFNDPNGLFTVNGSMVVSVKADMAANSGETLGVSLVGFQALGQTAVTLGSPIAGNLMTVATASLAGVSFGTVTPSANGGLTPASDIVVWQSTATVTTRDVWLTRFAIREVGGVAKADISNLRLMVDGTTVGTVANPDANGYATFAPTSPLSLKTGSHVFKVMADVTGGSSLSFTFSIRNRTDIGLVDSQYNVGFLTSTSVSSLAAGQQDVAVGYITVEKASDSPSSTVVLSGTDVLLAKFKATTYGERVKVDGLTVDFTSSDSTAVIRNGRVLVNGQQVGSTTNIDRGADTTCTDCGTLFNTNYTFETGVSYIEVRGDVYASSGTQFVDGDTVQVSLYGANNLNNAQGLSSGSASLDVPTASVSGNTLSVGTGSMTLAKDQAYGDQTVVVPTTGTLLGSWTLTSGTNEALNLDTIQADFTVAGDFGIADLTNVYVMYGSKTTSTKATVTATGNSWSISETLPVNTTMTFKVYGNIASGAVVDAGGDTVLSKLLVSGTSASGTAVSTNSGSVLSGQTMSAVSTGALTVTLDTNTPVAAQVVAGGTDSAGALKLKLAGTNEDQYLKTLRIYVDTSANSAAVASLNLSSSTTSNGTYTTVGTDQTLINDGTNPGYAVWNLSGSNRVTIAKNGSVYLKVTPTYVSSGQTAVSGLTPKLFLGDLQAEGTAVLSAGLASHVNTTGIIVKSNSSATYVNSTKTLGDDATAVATSLTSTTGSVFTPGDVIQVGAAGTELMVVLKDNGTSLTVYRGAFGTTAATHSNTDAIYRLDNASTTRGVIGNAVTVLNTKLGLALKSDSPSGAFTGGTGKYVFGVTASAANNSADSATNTATITYMDVTSNKSAATVSNLVAYPSEYDQNASYVTTCGALSTTKWRCTMSTAGSTNQVDENSSRSYVFRADLGYSGAGSADFSLASLGTSSTSTNSVYWTDGTTAQYWVNQPTTVIQGGSLTTTAASGTVDTTAPTISSIVMGNGGVLNDIDANDTITITYSEPIDPTTINASLVPGGSVTGVTGSSTGTVTVAQATAIVTVAGITTFDSGASVAVAVSAPTVTLALGSSSKVLTITITALTGGGTITTPAGGAGTQVATTVTDANGVASAAVATPAATGAF